jgi:hypothetical protein
MKTKKNSIYSPKQGSHANPASTAAPLKRVIQLTGGLLAFWGLLVYLVFYTSRPLADHTSLGIGVGVSSAINTESGATLPQGRLAVGGRAQYVNFDTLPDQEMLDQGIGHGTESLLNVPLSIFYGVTDNFTVGVRLLPYVRRSDIRVSAGHDHDHGHGHGHGQEDDEIERAGSADGLGDTILLGQYRFFQPSPMQHASVLFGVKAPTGRTGAKTRQGTRFDAIVQPGTGSWDGLAGLAYSYWFPPFAFDSSILYTLTTEGSQQTELGDVFDYNFALSYRIGGGDPGVFYGEQEALRWDLVAEINGEWRDQTKIASLEHGHGGNVVYVSPGIRLSSKKRWSAAVSVGIPVIKDLDPLEFEPDYRIIGNLGFSF